jgi:hypothetical protein
MPWYNFVSIQNNNNAMAENETVLSRGCCLIRRLVEHNGKQSNVVVKNAKYECQALIVIFGGDIQVRNLSLLKYGCAYYILHGCSQDIFFITELGRRDECSSTVSEVQPLEF